MSGERRRQKKNLEGLLKFCVEGTAAEDTTTNSSQFVEMDDEVLRYMYILYESETKKFLPILRIVRTLIIQSKKSNNGSNFRIEFCLLISCCLLTRDG